MISLQQASILVVDDSTTMRTLVLGMLRSLGAANLDVAESGEEALSKLSRSDYTLILSDWNMAPVDGPSLLKVVVRRQKPRANRFIFMTSERSWGHQTTARIEGADEFLVKPFQISTLKAKVEKVLQRA